jgi:uncharacterized protein (DUF58 family)
METAELLKSVRKIEIKTKGLSKQIFSGEYHSVFKGRGMAFSEVREYNQGDDVRLIDWNVTARTNSAHVKVFEEERELTVMLLIDVSASESFGTLHRFKQELATELSAILSFSAITNNDKIGVIFFSDKIEKFIPPKKGKSHTLRIIRELIEFKPTNKETNISVALKYLANVINKRCIAFVISDFISDNFETELRIAGKKHDVIASQLIDPQEKTLPDLGLVQIKDAETGKILWVDTSNSNIRNDYSEAWKYRQENLEKTLKRSKVDHIKLFTNESYIIPLQNFFKQRESRK